LWWLEEVEELEIVLACLRLKMRGYSILARIPIRHWAYSWQLEEIVDMAVKVEPMFTAIGLEVEVEQASLETGATKAIIPMTVEAVD
jgi:hypothetical protein